MFHRGNARLDLFREAKDLHWACCTGLSSVADHRVFYGFIVTGFNSYLVKSNARVVELGVIQEVSAVVERSSEMLVRQRLSKT